MGALQRRLRLALEKLADAVRYRLYLLFKSSNAPVDTVQMPVDLRKASRVQDKNFPDLSELRIDTGKARVEVFRYVSQNDLEVVNAFFERIVHGPNIGPCHLFGNMEKLSAHRWTKQGAPRRTRPAST
jgi:hypothetical protein